MIRECSFGCNAAYAVQSTEAGQARLPWPLVVSSRRKLFFRYHTVVVLIEPIECFGSARPFFAADPSIAVLVNLLESLLPAFYAVVPGLLRFFARDSSVVIAVEPFKASRSSFPLVARNLSVTVGVGPF